jgi:hypothetical protein
MHYALDMEDPVKLFQHLSTIFPAKTITSPEDITDELLQDPFFILETGNMMIYDYLKRANYKGFIVCKDIWPVKEIRDNFWYKIPYDERYEVAGCGIVSFNPEITFPKRDNSDWTLVTAYFDLTKCPDASVEINKRDSKHYTENAVSTMALPYNLVVYCEESNLETLKAMRPAYLQAKTKYVLRNFDDLKVGDGTFAEHRVKIQENRKKHPYHFDNRNTASYYLFCLSRYLMLKETIDDNSFGSTHFAWINICIERMGYKNVQRLDEALAVKRDRFSACYIDYIPESLVKNTPEYYRWGRCGMCSGFFTGNAEYMWKACDKIQQKFLEYLAAGYGHADEQLFSPVYFENKELFEHYYGDYKQMITNYVFIYDAAEPPIYNFIRNSYKHGDLDKCREACEFVWRSIEAGKCGCDKQFLDELKDYRRHLSPSAAKPVLLFKN